MTEPENLRNILQPVDRDARQIWDELASMWPVPHRLNIPTAVALIDELIDALGRSRGVLVDGFGVVVCDACGYGYGHGEFCEAQ